MNWIILVLAMHAPAPVSSGFSADLALGLLASEVKLPPASSSPVPRRKDAFDDVKFAQLLNVPADILKRLPADEAAYLAKLVRAGKPVYLSDQPWLT